MPRRRWNLDADLIEGDDLYMDKMAVRHNGNGDGAIIPANALAEHPTRAAWPDSLFAILMGRVARSEVPARRYWLRFLDAPLVSEIRAAGALDFDELAGAVSRILRCDESRVSRETIHEWWEFACADAGLSRLGLDGV